MDRGTQTSNERECLSNRCKFLWPRGFITVTQVSGNRRHTQKAGLAVNTAATPCSYLNTNRQYLLCTKAAGAQKRRASRGQIPAGFSRLALPRASCKENISGKEWTKPAKTSCWPGRVIIYGARKMWPNKIEDLNSTSMLRYCRPISIFFFFKKNLLLVDLNILFESNLLHYVK